MLSSPSDTTDSGESDPDFVVAPSSSSPASTEGEEDSEDPGSGWIARNDEVWFSTNAETTPFLQPARDFRANTLCHHKGQEHGFCVQFVFLWGR
ncbi:hypothetical protein QQF64_023772 [Cirrhinus molitorella]|uniref:Uncharacterized protein n=1 Tax=Cirrhinus molitorella TaxID=172907 RepID=A0ABR3NJL8_9TELE